MPQTSLTPSGCAERGSLQRGRPEGGSKAEAQISAAPLRGTEALRLGRLNQVTKVRGRPLLLTHGDLLVPRFKYISTQERQLTGSERPNGKQQLILQVSKACQPGHHHPSPPLSFL